MDSLLKYMESIRLVKPFGDAGKIYIALATPVSYKSFSDAGYYNIVGIGVHENKEIAKQEAMYEGFERMSNIIYSLKDQEFASYNEVRGCALDPRLFIPINHVNRSFTEFDYDEYLDQKKIRWVHGKCLSDGTDVLIPSFYVYAKYFYDQRGERYYHHTSTGTALHSVWDKAIYKSLAEIVERDALAIRWYTHQSPKLVQFTDLKDERLLNVLRCVSAAGCELKVNYLTLDAPLHVLSAMLLAFSPPYMSFGCAAATNVVDAMIKAIYEALLTRRMQQNKTADKALRKKDVRSLLDHAQYYTSNNHYEELCQWSESAGSIAVEECEKYPCAQTIKNLTMRLETITTSKIYYVDIKPKCFNHLPFHVVKSFIPGMIPMNCEHFAIPMGNTRLLSFMNKEIIPFKYENMLPYPLA